MKELDKIRDSLLGLWEKIKPWQGKMQKATENCCYQVISLLTTLLK